MHEQLKGVHNDVHLHSVDKKKITTIIKLELSEFPFFSKFQFTFAKMVSKL